MSARSDNAQERRVDPSAVGGLGVFGGTFNPVHLGHLRAAEEVVEALGLERLAFVPSARPPHKSQPVGSDDVIAPAADRLAWVRLAVADNDRFEVDPIEVERAGPSFLVDTLRSIGQRIAPQRPVFVVGRDAFQEVGEWREPRRLFELAHFAVVTRPPLQDGTLADWLPECARDDFQLAADGLSGQHRSAGTWIRLLAITALDVSASAIRERLREGRSARYLLPDAVERAVVASGCYLPASGEDSSGPASGPRQSSSQSPEQQDDSPEPNAQELPA
jgi:nicotinate-nucleotide adenylyltransferase